MTPAPTGYYSNHCFPNHLSVVSSQTRCDDRALSPVLLTPRAPRPFLVLDPISTMRRVNIIPFERNDILYLPVRRTADQWENISDTLKRTFVFFSLSLCCVALLYGGK
ncbi:unnamed protein product [Dicrocoelium dendriticum]|nr:unnamed protein product [Dicrocoelium dendriticum]